MEPRKEVLTTFYPPRHPEKTGQPTTRLVGVHVDQNLTMQDNINHILKKGRITKARLMRTRPSGAKDLLTVFYKTLMWFTLERMRDATDKSGSIPEKHSANDPHHG
ncbi:hypothetical protein CAPTEDRAFT_210074 [Capitella teleta]|uniref:Uncharacterized protein n=1 Tax=Capitella teleta TaxID=283909 RepID=R7VI50_CAPTE|nr:hypothetical protein CAPTEDRAFT_210074 [Capitella teleta]|eukprot:ELU18207.1 hypothetical protein CAPTEDRAFT_210074 [Capitella teleta]